jgi:hypothetical protein
VGAARREDASGLQAEARVRAGDHGRAPRQIGDVGLGPVLAAAGSPLGHLAIDLFRAV